MAQVPGFCPEGEEVKKMDNITKTKRKKIQPRKLRIKMYERVITLHRQGLSNKEIIDVIEREYGVRLSESTVKNWRRGRSSPYNGRYIPSLELLKPSKQLAYIIGVELGDGYTEKDGRIGLNAKDKEFVEEFAKNLSIVLGRRPIKLKFKKNIGCYNVRVISKTLYELLRKPVDLKRIKKYVEHCPECTAAFLRGLFDSEGHADASGYICVDNTDYTLLVYAQKLLKRFGIEATGPYLVVPKGTPIYDRRTGKQYKTNEDCYRLYIRSKDLMKFYRCVGFTIKRKQKQLEDYLRRTGKL
jgi:intein-encoded DNA endonuclease-like protein